MSAAAGPASARARRSTSPTPWSEIDGIALSGGSAFGLEAGGGVQAWLAEQGRGFRIRDAVIPIVPGAICFDLLNGGDKAWGRFAPYRDLGYAAAAAASDDFALGSAGAGLGATTANFKGGHRLGIGFDPGRHQGCGARGGQRGRHASRSATGRGSGRRRSRPAANLADADCRRPSRRTCSAMRMKGGAAATSVENTTLAVIVTDAALTKPQAKRLAMIAQTGFARAIYPVHAPLDGDVVFAAATGEKPIDPLVGLTELGMVAANVMARAIARGVYSATALPFPGALPAWRDRFGE